MGIIKVKHRQNIFDLAIQHLGGVDALKSLLKLNNISPSDILYADNNIIVGDVVDREIVEFYKSKGIIPASSFYQAEPPPLVVYDTDAVAYLTAANIVKLTTYSVATPQEITGQEIWDAVDTLVKTLKIKGLWAKYKAIYPYLGDLATSRMYNLINPLNTNAAHRLQFFGGITHGPKGFKPNGTNGYADTHINPATHLSLNTGFFGFYSMDNFAEDTVEMGSWDGVNQMVMYARLAVNSRMQVHFNANAAIDFANNFPTGINHGQRESSTTVAIFNKKTLLRRSVAYNAVARPNEKMFLGATSHTPSGVPIYHSSRNQCITYFGADFFSPTEYDDHVDAIDHCMLMLKRNN